MVRMADLARDRPLEPKKETDRQVESEQSAEDGLKLRELPELRGLYQELRQIFSSQEFARRSAVEEEAPRPAEPKTPPDRSTRSPVAELDGKSQGPGPEVPAPPKPSPVPPEDAGDRLRIQTETSRKLRADFETLYDTAYHFLSDVLSDMRSGRQFTLTEGSRIVKQMIASPAAIEGLYRKATHLPQDYEELSSHLVNVSIYAIRLGQGLDYPKEDLLRLGFAGTVYDIGLAKVPDSILHKSGQLTEQEKKIISQHPQYGYEILRAALPKETWLARVALEHHERENGEGYPHRLSGEEISEYAKVIGLADIYDGATRVRSYKKRKLPFEAVREILQSERGKFPRRIFRALLVNLSVFPIGSYVRLNSRAVGVVIGVNESSPLRPKVELLYDSQGRKLMSQKVVDLQQNSILHIVAPIEEEELPQTG